MSKVSRIDIFEIKNRQFMCRKITKFRQEKKHGTNWNSNKNTRKRERERERKKNGDYNANQMISFGRARN